MKRFHDVFIVIEGKKATPIIAQINLLIESSECNSEILAFDGEKSHLRILTRVFKRLLFSRPQVVFLSGHVLCLTISTIAKFLAVRYRVLFRHYAGYHHLIGSQIGILKDKILAKFATDIIAISPIVKSVLAREGTSEEKIQVLPYGANLEKFVGIWNENVFLQRKESKKFTIGMISRVSKTKGINLAIAAIEKIRSEHDIDVELQIVGALSDDFEVSELIESGVLQWLNWINHSDHVWDYFQGWDLLIHVPISAEAEGFGLVYLEALASGIPCIFTPSGALVDMQEHGPQVQIIDFNSIPNLERAILTVIESRKHFHRHSFREDSHSLKEMEKRFNEILDKLLT